MHTLITVHFVHKLYMSFNDHLIHFAFSAIGYLFSVIYKKKGFSGFMKFFINKKNMTDTVFLFIKV